uniref:Uncharacterized protein n=1 Tax=Chromera velia CCMP2878 TaxID=1169474 RepID=A0A0G4G2G9_9ALVE|eukprot:Cvel_19977.t1-p1 / transcript=Cvel_19977.t1 / gene=Cvel_19977 / organism=Chromera_velia_CCMP2878 / gene_product=hypothetical protein / transcript_product=hypothetical protein / location=Cvel_scaffold1759:30481-32176(-) / protein_length=388 / sequence_SO=supercontig / SO=protein_coding / is_pseudo=false
MKEKEIGLLCFATAGKELEALLEEFLDSIVHPSDTEESVLDGLLPLLGFGPNMDAMVMWEALEEEVKAEMITTFLQRMRETANTCRKATGVRLISDMHIESLLSCLSNPFVFALLSARLVDGLEALSGTGGEKRKNTIASMHTGVEAVLDCIVSELLWDGAEGGIVETVVRDCLIQIVQEMQNGEDEDVRQRTRCFLTHHLFRGGMLRMEENKWKEKHSDDVAHVLSFIGRGIKEEKLALELLMETEAGGAEGVRELIGAEEEEQVDIRVEILNSAKAHFMLEVAVQTDFRNAQAEKEEFPHSTKILTSSLSCCCDDYDHATLFVKMKRPVIPVALSKDRHSILSVLSCHPSNGATLLPILDAPFMAATQGFVREGACRRQKVSRSAN